MKNPTAIAGRLIVSLMGKSCGRAYWQDHGCLYEPDGSILYSAIQKKSYRDVGRSATGFVLSLPFMAMAFSALVFDQDAIANPDIAVICLAFIIVWVINLFNLRSDLRNSQMIHVAGCAARDDPNVRAGITDDVFGEDEDEEDEATDEGVDEIDDADGVEDDEEEVDQDMAPGNVVDFRDKRLANDDPDDQDQQQNGEVW